MIPPPTPPLPPPLPPVPRGAVPPLPAAAPPGPPAVLPAGSSAGSIAPPAGALGPALPPADTVARGPEDSALKERVIAALKTVYDPEIPVNIYEMGMIYEVRADTAGEIYVKMTLTSPMCPVAGSLPPEVEAKARKVEGATSARVDLVWEPPWEMAMISEAAKLQLNL